MAKIHTVFSDREEGLTREFSIYEDKDKFDIMIEIQRTSNPNFFTEVCIENLTLSELEQIHLRIGEMLDGIKRKEV